MDGHHLPPHGALESTYQNGYNTNDEYSNILASGPDNENYANWGFDTHTNVASNPQPDPYLSWQPSNTGLDNYDAHTFAKNPSNLHSNSYNGYGDPHQFAPSPYDPSLVSAGGVTTGASSYGIGNPYSQQPMQHGTIAPQALEQERAHVFRPEQTLNHQPYAQNNVQNADAAAYTKPTTRPTLVNQAALIAGIPPSTLTNGFRIINSDKLNEATKSIKVRPFINISQEDFEYPCNKATLPPLVRRKSRNELRILAKTDAKLQAKLKRPIKKGHHTIKPAQLNQPPSATSAQDVSSSETESSDYDSSDESEDEDPLPPQRPEDPREAVRYDTIKALRVSSRYEVGTERIRTGIIEYGEIILTLKDRLKADQKALADATEQKKSADIPLLKSRVDTQLDLLEVSLKAGLEYGHRAILDQLGKHIKFVLSINQLLVGQYKASDTNRPLTRLLLEFLTSCTSLTDNTLVDTKLQKTLNVLNKAGNSDVQELCKRIKGNATSAAKASEQPTKPAMTNAQAVKSPPSNRPTPEPVAGMKRSAPGNAQSDQASKRVLTSSGAGAVSNSTAKNPSVLRRTVPVVGPTKPGTPTKAVPGAVKPKPAISKPVSSVPSAGPTIKKAVTAKAPSVVAAAIKSIEKKATPVAPAKPAKPAFSFAETMANLNKPKEKEPTPKVEEKQISETPQERAKRLRKEERRKLRVTFKPDSQLVQVRLFHHDADEELGHDASMIRDVGDVGGEGRMFKQHKDMMDVDEEDDATSEDNSREYQSPSLTDFSTVDVEERKRNYAPYGGGEMHPDSPERKAREQYEASTLMVFYTHPSDIPSCPREPANPYDGEEVTTKAFGSPDAEGIFATRAAQLGGTPQQTQPQNQQSSTAPDISALLAMFNTPNQASVQPIQPPTVPAPAQDPMSEIQRILANLPSAQPPQQPVQPPQPSMPADLAGIFATLQPQAPPVSAPQPPQQQAFVPDGTPANLASFLTQFAPGQNGGPGQGNFGQFGFPGAGLNVQNMGQAQPSQHQQSQPQHHYENEERRRWRERGDDDNHNRRGKGFKKSGGFVDKRFTVPCKYFAIGKCQKGSNCTYRHES